MNPTSSNTNEAPWLSDLRARMPVTARCVYFQTGSKGPMSQPALDALIAGERLAATEGPVAPAAKTPLVEADNAARVTLGRLLNVPAGELCWSHNTSTAMRTVFHSLRPTAADLIVTSDVEHVATRSLLAGLRDACGLSVVTLPADDDAFLERLAQALESSGSGRKIVLLSHVSCLDGRRLPVESAVELTRHHGGISLIDGAQAVGQFPVDLARIGADYYVASGHKWLFGPSGIGYIHVRKEQLRDFNPNWLPDNLRAEATAAALGEAGSINHAQRAALGVAVELLLAIGLEHVDAHVSRLRQRLSDGLRQMDGLRLLGPREPGRGTGLVSFTKADWSASFCQSLVEQLYLEHRILIKYQPEQTALRVSLAAFNTDDEVDLLLRALRAAAEYGPSMQPVSQKDGLHP